MSYEKISDCVYRFEVGIYYRSLLDPVLFGLKGEHFTDVIWAINDTAAIQSVALDTEIIPNIKTEVPQWSSINGAFKFQDVKALQGSFLSGTYNHIGIFCFRHIRVDNFDFMYSGRKTVRQQLPSAVHIKVKPSPKLVLG